MSTCVVAGQPVELRADGRLAHSADWSPELAVELAAKDGLTLSDKHWDIINIMREYYNEYNISPILKLLRREVAKKLGAERALDESLYALFPNGVQHQGSRIAGIPLALLDAELDQNALMQAVQPASAVHFNDQFEFNGQTIKVYASGNLFNPEDWSEAMAERLAQKEGIQLTNEHWAVIKFLRGFYFQYGITPMVKVLIKHMVEKMGSQAANEQHLYQLFPGGPARQGSRIAGLPSPQGCIDA
jgi:tRNA 2-thiouridine synthesizing protein E